MGNQMIMPKINLLKLPDPAAQTAKFVNMMNMTRQQEAAERQAAAAQQQMDYATAEETRKKDLHGPALTKAQQDNAVQALEMFRERVGDIAEGDVAAAEAVRADLVARIPGYDQFIPPASQWTRDTIERLMMTSEKEIDKLYATPTTETIFGPDDKLYVAQKGGLNEGLRPLMNRPPAGAPAEAPRATPTAPQMPNTGADMRATRGANTTPQDLMQQGMDPRNIPSGMPTVRPASFSPGASAGQMTPQRAQQIVDAAVNTRVMAQEDFDQLIALTPEQNRRPFMEMIQANNIKLQPGGMGQQPQFAVNQRQRPQADFAVNRGATPAATLAQTNVVGQQAYGRSASPTSPLPGSSQVPLSRVAAEAAVQRESPAEAAAKKRAATQVDIEMAPELAKATKSAERAVELRSTATKAKYAVEGILNDVADRINTIDRLLRNPNRFSIVGAIEGNLPRLLQTGARADAQAAFDKIKNTATLTSLIDLRKSTDSGTSPVGTNPTDKDAKLVEQAASEFIQTGETSKFDANLIDMRRKLYRTFQSAQREHEGVYADVLKENPNLRLVVPKVSDRYLSTKDMPKQKTPAKTPTSRLSAETRAKYGL